MSEDLNRNMFELNGERQCRQGHRFSGRACPHCELEGIADEGKAVWDEIPGTKDRVVTLKPRNDQ